MIEEELNEEEIEVLEAIFYRKHVGLKKSTINGLLLRGFIAHRFPRGWAPSSKGRRYLTKLNKIQ